VALMVRKGMQALGVDCLMDSGIQRRITGWSVDYLIMVTVAAIQLRIAWPYWMPISRIAAANGILTTCLVVWFGRRLAAFSLERTIAMYGTVTGTVSCGLLLRIYDPDFRTPAALEMALMNILVRPIVGGRMLMVNAPLCWGRSVGVTLSVFTGIVSHHWG
jgi:ESS family glutamate:Na+ symporter